MSTITVPRTTNGSTNGKTNGSSSTSHSPNGSLFENGYAKLQHKSDGTEDLWVENFAIVLFSKINRKCENN